MVWKWKTAARIALIVVVVLLLGAVVIGVLNALLADGEWSFGWSDYSYDDRGYHIGDGTIYAQDVTSIAVDWIDGAVQIVVCGDVWPSVTEQTTSALTEDSRMRWCVSEDGHTLSIKYRKSSRFLGSSENKNKNLILRIPERMMEQLDAVEVNVRSAQVQIVDVTASKLSVSGISGDLSLQLSKLPQAVTLDTKKGNVLLSLPEAASFSLTCDDANEKLPTLDFPVTREENRYVCGNGLAEIRVHAEKGNVTVTKQKNP